jgi:flap endonuclease-1
MGIKGLSAFLRKRAQTAFMPMYMRNLSGKRVAVDVAILAYKYSYSREDASDTAFMSDAFYHNYLFMRSQNVHVTYVFDGPTRSEKMFERERRNRARENALNRQVETMEQLTCKRQKLSQECDGVTLIREITHIEEAMKQVKRRVVFVTKDDYRCIQQKFRDMDVPFLVATHDAEDLCAKLCKQNRVDFAASDDYDTLTCGAPRVLRNMLSSTRDMEMVCLQTILGTLEMTQPEFVDFCILCGCDFTEHLHKVGPVTAFKAIKEFGTIEKVLEAHPHIKKLAQEEDFGTKFNYIDARACFLEQ